MSKWPPDERTQKYFFLYWILFCIVSVFSGFGHQLFAWFHSLPWLLDWAMFVLTFGALMLVLYKLALFSSQRTSAKDKE